jgi:hypothetical protein
MADIRSEVDGPVARITLDRPRARNAMTTGMVIELFRELTELSGRTDIRVVELTGSGDRFFCPGADLDRSGSGRDSSSGSQAPAIDVSFLRVPVLLHEMPPGNRRSRQWCMRGRRARMGMRLHVRSFEHEASRHDKPAASHEVAPRCAFRANLRPSQSLPHLPRNERVARIDFRECSAAC